MIGNDIVDLWEADVRSPGAVSSACSRRVFSDKEIRLLAALPADHGLHRLSASGGRESSGFSASAGMAELPLRQQAAWAFWAAKEAGFKCASRFDPQLPFIWRSFEVDPAAFLVKTPLGEYPLRLHVCEDFIYAVCVERASMWRLERSSLVTMDDEERKNPSCAVRSLAVRACANTYQIPLVQVQIGRRGSSIPREAPTIAIGCDEIAVSYTHHGRYAAAAVLLNTSGRHSISSETKARGEPVNPPCSMLSSGTAVSRGRF